MEQNNPSQYVCRFAVSDSHARYYFDWDSFRDNALQDSPPDDGLSWDVEKDKDENEENEELPQKRASLRKKKNTTSPTSLPRQPLAESSTTRKPRGRPKGTSAPVRRASSKSIGRRSAELDAPLERMSLEIRSRSKAKVVAQDSDGDSSSASASSAYASSDDFEEDSDNMDSDASESANSVESSEVSGTEKRKRSAAGMKTPRKSRKLMFKQTPRSKAAQRARRDFKNGLKLRPIAPPLITSTAKLPDDPRSRALNVLHVGSRPDSLTCRDTEYADIFSSILSLLEEQSGGCVCE